MKFDLQQLSKISALSIDQETSDQLTQCLGEVLDLMQDVALLSSTTASSINEGTSTTLNSLSTKTENSANNTGDFFDTTNLTDGINITDCLFLAPKVIKKD